jgi:hypothetical protein
MANRPPINHRTVGCGWGVGAAGPASRLAAGFAGQRLRALSSVARRGNHRERARAGALFKFPTCILSTYMLVNCHVLAHGPTCEAR